MARLVITTKGRKKKVLIPLTEKALTIGRASKNHLKLIDKDVSKEHAKIRFQDGKYVVTDLWSTNGTHLNHKKIREQVLHHGDKIRISKFELTFYMEEEQPKVEEDPDLMETVFEMVAVDDGEDSLEDLDAQRTEDGEKDVGLVETQAIAQDARAVPRPSPTEKTTMIQANHGNVQEIEVPKTAVRAHGPETELRSGEKTAVRPSAPGVLPNAGAGQHPPTEDMPLDEFSPSMPSLGEKSPVSITTPVRASSPTRVSPPVEGTEALSMEEIFAKPATPAEPVKNLITIQVASHWLDKLKGHWIGPMANEQAREKRKPTGPPKIVLLAACVFLALSVLAGLLSLLFKEKDQEIQWQRFVIMEGELATYPIPLHQSYRLEGTTSPPCIEIMTHEQDSLTVMANQIGQAWILLRQQPNKVYRIRVDVYKNIVQRINQNRHIAETYRGFTASQLLERAERLVSSVETIYKRRQYNPGNLYKAWVEAIEAQCVVERIPGVKPPLYHKIKQLVKTYQNELNDSFNEHWFSYFKAMHEGQWLKVREELEFLMKLVPDREDERNQIVQEEYDFHQRYERF